MTVAPRVVFIPGKARPLACPHAGAARLHEPTYPAFGAMLMAGIDGIKNKLEPPDPMRPHPYEFGLDYDV